MIQVKFIEQEIEELHDIQENHFHAHVRKKTLVLILKSQGFGHAQIASIARIYKNVIRNYLRGFQKGGIDWITSLNFRKPESNLKPFEQEIREYFEKTPPASVKQASAEIAALTGVKLKETQMRMSMKSLGLKFRKASGIPAKADPIRQAEFLENKLNPRLEEAKNEERTLYFMDAAHFVYASGDDCA